MIARQRPGNRRRLAQVLFLLVTGLFLHSGTKGQGTWVPLAHLAPQTSGGVMVLLTDGTVLCKTDAGGGQGTLWCKLTPDASGSYVNGTWTTVAPMANDRLYFSSQVLRDGRLYVCGGEYGAGGSLGETYDPLANTWTAAPATGFFVSDANSEILPDGRVLQACVGSGTRHTRIWDPATNTYSLGPDCLRTDNEAPWLKLPDSSIVFIDNYSTSSERYIPATNTWINDGTVPVNVYDPFGDEAGAAFLLPDGRGFFIGSSGHNAYYTPSGNLTPGTWSAGPDIPGAQGTPDAASAMMVTGNILLAVSPIPTSSNHFPSPTAFYEFNYLTNTFTAVGAPGGGTSLAGVSSYITNMLDLPDGTVLFVLQGDNQYYEYVPSGAPLAAGQPTVNNVFRVNCDTFMATGTLFNGISEGAGYGDDWQMASNYPIIRLQSGTNVYYTRTYNWNSTGVRRGAKPDTTMFVIPATLPVTTYSLTVVANGIASAGFSFNPGFTNVPTSFSVCAGLTNTVTNPWSGGVWSSGNNLVATVGPTTGIVTGVATGVTNISYTVGTCTAVTTVTVNTSAPAIVPAGGAGVCVGSSLSLTDPTFGGSWSSNAPGTATVGVISGIVNGVSAGVATISYTIGSCFATEPVTVSPLPPASITPVGPTTFCAGSSVLLTTASGAGYTYQWQLAGSAISGATDVTYNAFAGGTYTVVITTPQGCSAISSGVVVTVNTPPTATITPTGATSICAGDVLVLNANPGLGFTYQWQLGGSDIPGATNVTYSTGSGGSYTVVVTDGSTGCSSTSPATVITVNPAPPAITGTPTVCVGSTTLLGDPAGGGAWSSSNTLIATVGSAGLVTGMGTGGTATISYTLGTGCAAAVVVTVNSSVAAAISGASSVCAGQSITLADVTPGGAWSSSNSSLASVGSGTGVVTGVSAGTVIITYFVASACGVATATTLVTINPAPAIAPVTGATTVCPAATSHLADIAPGGTWSSSNVAVASIGTSGIVTGGVLGSSVITYSITSAFGCTATVTTSFTVANPLSVAITPAGLVTFCTGAYVVLNSTTGSGLSYQWQNGGVNIPGATSSAYTASASGNFAVVVSNAGGCNATALPVTVSVNPSPIVVPSVSIAASPGTTFCVAAPPVTFTATATNGGAAPAFQWFLNGTAIAAGATYPYATPVSGDVISCVLTSSNACAFPVTASARDTIHVMPLQTPAVSIVSNPSTVCEGDTVKFSAIPVYGGTAPTFLWTQNGVNVATGPDYIYIPSNGDVLKCTMVSNYPCLTTTIAVSSNFPVTVHPRLPNTLTVTVSQSSIPAGRTDTFVATAPNAGSAASYQWLINGLPVPGATTATYITNTLMNGQVVSCEETASTPCAEPGTVISSGITIIVQPSGLVQLSGGSNFTLLPNPNKGEFTVDGVLGDPASQVSIVITDMLGQAVYSEIANGTGGRLTKRITLDNLIANGMYLVHITSGNDHAVFHMVVGR